MAVHLLLGIKNDVEALILRFPLSF